MDKQSQILLCECIVKQENKSFPRFCKGDIYEYFVINAKGTNDNQIFSEELYFIKDPWTWYNESYVMLKKSMFDKMFTKLHQYIEGENKTNEFLDNTQIVTEDKEISNDRSFIETNEYR